MTEHATPPKKRVTVVDVARAAGVSAGTVSNAISGKRKVDDATRVRIETAIRDLGYLPNLAARRMRTGRTNTIAIFSSMPTAVAGGSSKLGFLMEIAASAAITAMEMNTALMLIPAIDDPIEALKSIAMDGALIVEPEENDPVLAMMERMGVPTVSIGKPIGSSSSYVDLDYHTMAEMLIDHLCASGATNFPLVVGKSARHGNLVFKEVYRRRAAEAGMTPHILEVREALAEDAAAAAIANAIADNMRFDAVLVPIDAMATGVMRALRHLHRSVPSDVRVVTRYDGVRARTETPPLTAVDLKLDDIAQIATRNLNHLIEGENSKIVIAAPIPSLVVRGSSDARSRSV
jgi:DNA-binding LacI/PurR family transcriptional regulator